MKCIHCNRIIPGGASFCPYCGQEQDLEGMQETDELKEQLLKRLSEETTEELPDVPWDERDRREYRREYTRRESSKSSKRYLGVIAVVILIMALLMVAIWIVFTTMDANERRMLEEREQALAQSQKEEQEQAEADLKNQKEQSDDQKTSDGKEKDKDSKAEDIRLAFVGEPGDFGEYYKLSIADASASSVISQEGTDNGAHKAVDGNSKTSWQEGVDGDGIGENIHLKLSKPYMVKYMSFQLGNWTSSEYYDGNNRPKELEITAGDVTQTVTFPDGKVEYWVEFSKECPAEEISVVIQSVYEGSKWDDTCIAEIGIYGKGN